MIGNFHVLWGTRKNISDYEQKELKKKIKKDNLSWKSLKLRDNYNNSLQVNFWQWQSSLGNDGSASCHLGNDADKGAWPGTPNNRSGLAKAEGTSTS